jgi:integrase
MKKSLKDKPLDDFSRLPWNKGKSVGQMKPFTPRQVRLIKDILEEKQSLRDITLLSVGIDTMLRSSDLLTLKVIDVTNPDGTVRKEFQIRQKKTGKGHLVALSQNSQEIVRRWIAKANKFEDDYLFTGLKGKRKYTPLTHRQYTRLVKRWAMLAHLNPKEYSTHSLRRTKAALIYQKTGNIEVVRQLLGQHSVTATQAYLNVSKRQALEVAQAFEI